MRLLGQIRYLFQIHDENDSYGIFCGSSLPPTGIRPESGVVYVSFYSDDSINGKGFEALYAVIGNIDNILGQKSNDTNLRVSISSRAA